MAREARSDRQRVGALDGLQKRVERIDGNGPLVGLRQRKEHRFRSVGLDRGHGVARRSHDHQAGAQASGSARDQRRRSCHRAGSGDHEQHARPALVPLHVPARQTDGDVIGFGELHRRAHEVGGEADINYTNRARSFRPWQQYRPDLRGAQRHGELCPDGRALDRAGRPVDPGRDVDRDHRGRRGVEPIDRVLPRRLGCPPEPGTEDGVDRDVAAVEQARRILRRPAAWYQTLLAETLMVHRRRTAGAGVGLHHDDIDPHARSAEMASCDETITAVVALAAHHQGASAVRASRDLDRAASDRSPGSFHEIGGADPAGLAGSIELARLIRREDRLHRRSRSGMRGEVMRARRPRRRPRSSSRG